MRLAATACDALADALKSLAGRIFEGTLTPADHAEALDAVCARLREMARAFEAEAKRA